MIFINCVINSSFFWSYFLFFMRLYFKLDLFFVWLLAYFKGILGEEKCILVILNS